MNIIDYSMVGEFFQPGDKVMLREKELRSREYPEFMEGKIYLVHRLSTQKNPRLPFAQRFFILDDSGRYVVETDGKGNIINGRFDSVDFVHV